MNETLAGFADLTLGLEDRDEDGALPDIVGFASVFNKESDGLPWVEVVKPGAFDRVISEQQDVRALVNHDPARIIGRSRGGESDTLRLEITKRGLKTTIQPPNNSEGRGVVESIRRGDLDGMSIGFRTVADDWMIKGKKEVREITDIDLFDVSVVAFPAFKKTEAGLRSLEVYREKVRHDKSLMFRLAIAERDKYLRSFK
jgi:HK97 family phage prohead protease